MKYQTAVATKAYLEKTLAEVQAMKEASRIAAENGIADLSLDEINAEIAAARSH